MSQFLRFLVLASFGLAVGALLAFAISRDASFLRFAVVGAVLGLSSFVVRSRRG